MSEYAPDFQWNNVKWCCTGVYCWAHLELQLVFISYFENLTASQEENLGQRNSNKVCSEPSQRPIDIRHKMELFAKLVNDKFYLTCLIGF